jgi:hypothetical protein
MATYKKLSRHHRGMSGYSRLWLAEDHILLVTSSGYSEEYRRFFFADIQALIVQATRWERGANWTFGGAALVFGALGFTTSGGGAIMLWIVAGVSALLVGINAALGPRCSVHIQTAIAKHPLEPLQRLREARKVIARVLPLIQSTQGTLTPEQLADITRPEVSAAAPSMAGS